MGNKFYDSWQKFLSEGDGWVDPLEGNPDAQKRYYLQLGSEGQRQFKEEYPDYPYDEWDAEATNDDELDYDPDDAPAGVLGKEYRDSIARFRAKQHKEDPTLRARVWEEDKEEEEEEEEEMLGAEEAPAAEEETPDEEAEAPADEEETVAPPAFLQSAQGEDTAAQGDVLRAAEQKWGLPFTNRDIRILLMKYLEKFDSLIAEKNFDDAATITGRAVDYIDNLKIKVRSGTAAYPAQSNEIDKGLSMFYYQSPDFGNEFKQWCISVLKNFTGFKDGFAYLASVKQLAKMLGAKDSHVDKDNIISTIQSSLGYDLIKKASIINLRHAGRRRWGGSLFAAFFSSIAKTQHVEAMLKRMQNAERSLAGFNEFMGVASDDDQQFSMDMLLDALDETKSSLMKLHHSRITFVDPITRVVLNQREEKEGLISSLETSISDIENNDFRSASKKLRALSSRISTHASAGGSEHHEKDIQSALRKISSILAMVDMQRYGRDQIIKNRIRMVRKSVESFLTLFESKERNRTLTTKENFSKFMKQDKLKERYMIGDEMSELAMKYNIAPIELKYIRLDIEESAADEIGGSFSVESAVKNALWWLSLLRKGDPLPRNTPKMREFPIGKKVAEEWYEKDPIGALNRTGKEPTKDLAGHEKQDMGDLMENWRRFKIS